MNQRMSLWPAVLRAIANRHYDVSLAEAPKAVPCRAYRPNHPRGPDCQASLPIGSARRVKNVQITAMWL